MGTFLMSLPHMANDIYIKQKKKKIKKAISLVYLGAIVLHLYQIEYNVDDNKLTII